MNPVTISGDHGTTNYFSSREGVQVYISHAPKELGSLPQEGVMTVRFCRDKMEVDTANPEDEHLDITLRFTEVLDVKAEESDEPEKEDVPLRVEDVLDKLFHEAQESETEEDAEEVE